MQPFPATRLCLLNETGSVMIGNRYSEEQFYMFVQLFTVQIELGYSCF